MAFFQLITSKGESTTNVKTTKQQDSGAVLVPDYAMVRQRERHACTMAAIEYLKSMQEPWRQQGVPLLARVLLSAKPNEKGGPPLEDPPVLVYHLFFAIRITPRNDLWKRKGHYWFYCDYDTISSQNSKQNHNNNTPTEVYISNLVRGQIVGQRGDSYAGASAVMAVECPYFNDTYILHRVPVVSEEDIRKKRNSALAPVVVNYDVALPAKCAHQDLHDHQKYTLPELQYLPKYAACVWLFGDRKWGRYSVYDKYRQWIAYNRAIGVDHFLVYLQEPWPQKVNKDTNENGTVYLEQYLPSAPYITYLPFDVYGLKVEDQTTLGGGASEKNFFQPILQTECIYRARTWFPSVKWVGTSDIDEYPQVMVKTPPPPPPPPRNATWNIEAPDVTRQRQLYPLKELFMNDPHASFSWNVTEHNATMTSITSLSESSLEQMRRQMPHLDWILDNYLLPNLDGRLSAVNIPVVWFGENREYNGEDGIWNDFEQTKRHVLEYVHSASAMVKTTRQKSWCAPWNVVYYHIHAVTEPNPLSARPVKMDPEQSMRLSHFKRPDRGVRLDDCFSKQCHIVRDTSLRDTYLQVVRAMQKQMEFYYDSDGQGIGRKGEPAPAKEEVYDRLRESNS